MTTNENSIQSIHTELEAGIRLAKCRKCGCMREVLDSLVTLLPAIGTDETQFFIQNIEEWSRQMESVRYACLGCEHCYPVVAQNIFAHAFPSVDQSQSLACDFQVVNESWPPVVGEYFVLDKRASVAVSTLASIDLAEELAVLAPKGLAVVGKTETENIGLDKVVKNVITNPSICYLILAGNDPTGHQSGGTLLALAKNGIDSNGRVITSPGRRSVLRNVTANEVKAFREQVQMIDMIGCHKLDEINDRIAALSQQNAISCGCSECAEDTLPVSISTVSTIVATEPGQTVKMDKAGYFVIVPVADQGFINVEHYAYDNTLLHVIKGTNAREIYATIIANGWVVELSHAAYLGKELTRAELSLVYGFRYIQDGA